MVLAYDFVHGFNVEILIDTLHKRSALVKCSRAKFFQISRFRFTEADERMVREGNPDRIFKL